MATREEVEETAAGLERIYEAAKRNQELLVSLLEALGPFRSEKASCARMILRDEILQDVDTFVDMLGDASTFAGAAVTNEDWDKTVTVSRDRLMAILSSNDGCCLDNREEVERVADAIIAGLT